MAFTNTRLWQLFQLSTIGLTILLIIDLGKVFAQTESKANSINLTANNSTIPETFFVSNSPEISSPEDHAIVNINLNINNYDVVDTDQEPKPLMFSYQANQSEEQKDVWEKNLVWDQEKILAILETRFKQIPDSIVKQISQVKNPPQLKQLYRIAEVSSSLEEFQAILPSMTINSEQITTITTDEIAKEEQKSIRLTAETLQELKKYWKSSNSIFTREVLSGGRSASGAHPSGSATRANRSNRPAAFDVAARPRARGSMRSDP